MQEEQGGLAKECLGIGPRAEILAAQRSHEGRHDAFLTRVASSLKSHDVSAAELTPHEAAGALASTTNPLLAPFGEALGMLPWNRTASPWQQGSVLFRLPNGVASPYDPLGGCRRPVVLEKAFLENFRR